MLSWFKKPTLEDQLFDLKYTSKQLINYSNKCNKEEKAAKAQLKKAIQAGNMDSSRIYAENAIRKKNESLNYMKMSSRIDAVASRVQTAVTTQSVTSSMGNVVRSMAVAMRSMNLEKVSTLMDQFEKEFESLDVQSQVMEGTMNNTTSLTAPSNDVDSLMKEAADEAGIELDLNFPNGVNSSIATASNTSVLAEDQDLTERLARLRQA